MNRANSRESRAGTIAVAVIASAALARSFSPGLMLNGNLPAGGDLASHHYLARSAHRLGLWRLWVWDPGWFAGMPMFHYYFPLPYVAIRLLDGLLPYPIAFKLVAAAGAAALPFALYGFARLTGAPRPVPQMALALGIVFAYNDSYVILGGNIAGSMAGQIGYALALPLSLMGAGLAYRRMRTITEGDAPSAAGPAVLFSAALLCHALPVLPIAVVPAAALARTRTLRQLRYLATVGMLAVGLGAIWLFPLLARYEFIAGQTWRPVRSLAALAGGPACDETCRWNPWLLMAALAAAAAIPLCALRRERSLAPAALLTLAGGGLYLVAPTGAVLNLRWLPVALCGVLLMAAHPLGYAVDWIGRWVDRLAERHAGVAKARGEGRPARVRLGAAVPVAAAALIAVAAVSTGSYAPSWTDYDFSGFEAKEGWAEYRELMDAIERVGPERVMAEYSPEYEKFGTTRAVELIPYFAGAPAMEGLLFESSLTSSFHFVMQSEVSEHGSGAVPGMSYPGFDFGRGLVHMRLYGITHFVAYSTAAKSAAHAAGLASVAMAGDFEIFRVPGGGLVEVADATPVAYSGGNWRDMSLIWFREATEAAVPILFSRLSPTGEAGPVAASLPEFGSGGEQPAALAHPTGASRTGASPDAARPIPHTRPAPGMIEFDTDQPGRAHIIRESWFPTWRAEGAEGPYMLSPTVMVVFPTSRHVRLVQDASGPERAGLAVSALAWAGAVFSCGFARRRRRRRNPAPGASTAPGSTSERAPPR